MSSPISGWGGGMGELLLLLLLTLQHGQMTERNKSAHLCMHVFVAVTMSSHVEDGGSWRAAIGARLKHFIENNEQQSNRKNTITPGIALVSRFVNGSGPICYASLDSYKWFNR